MLEYDRKIINDDRVKITLKSFLEPSATSPYDDNSFGYHTLKNSIREIYTDVLVVPGKFLKYI